MTPEAFRKNLQRARAKFIELLVQELRETIHPTNDEDVEAEIFDLGLGHLYRRYMQSVGTTDARTRAMRPRERQRRVRGPRIPSAGRAFGAPGVVKNSPVPLTAPFHLVHFIEGKREAISALHCATRLHLGPS